jgi:hypothetical protein
VTPACDKINRASRCLLSLPARPPWPSQQLLCCWWWFTVPSFTTYYHRLCL